jgi:EAL domain-containing protein (putative c-di-GMP-specific phosphodiesterase class I)
VDRNPKDAAIVRAISALARSLGIGFVAEGVEEAGQAEYLETCDCAEMQGYLFSAPVPAEELPEILSRFGLRTSRLTA